MARAETYRAVDDRGGAASEQSWIFQKRDLSFSDSEDQVDDPYDGIPLRLSKPGEAKNRLVVEDTNEMVPTEETDDVELTPRKTPNRSIASDIKIDLLPPVEKKLVQERSPKVVAKGVTLRIENPIPESARERAMGLQEVSLFAADNGFFPKNIVVTQGVPVLVYLSTPSKNMLCFMQDDLNLRKGVVPGAVE